MLKLFKKSEKSDTKVSVVSFKGKTTNEVIEEIHESFFTEVNKLLAAAKIENSLYTDKQILIDKCARLKALGFTNTIEVKEAEGELERLEILRKDNKEKKTLIETINYFSFKYPNYKFITEESVKKICEKYNLVYGEIGKYIGTVPDKNLKHIEDFKVLEDDECFIHEEHYSRFMMGDRIISKEYLSFSIFKSMLTRKSELLRLHHFDMYFREIDMKCPLEIAAPIKDFNMEGREVKDYKISKIEIPDPIVLKPVIFNKQKHYLIVTAWGIEAGDEIIVNANHN